MDHARGSVRANRHERIPGIAAFCRVICTMISGNVTVFSYECAKAPIHGRRPGSRWSFKIKTAAATDANSARHASCVHLRSSLVAPRPAHLQRARLNASHYLKGEPSHQSLIGTGEARASWRGRTRAQEQRTAQNATAARICVIRGRYSARVRVARSPRAARAWNDAERAGVEGGPQNASLGSYNS